MRPRRRAVLVRWLLAGAGTFVLGCALFGLLAYWRVVQAIPGDDPAAAHPAWYLDPDDASWQLPLGEAEEGLGRSAGRAVQVCGVTGEQAYLASLLCPGDPPSAPFHGPFGVTDARREVVYPALRSRAVDRYEVPCPGAAVPVFVSPYGCNGEVTERAAGGFLPRFPRVP